MVSVWEFSIHLYSDVPKKLYIIFNLKHLEVNYMIFHFFPSCTILVSVIQNISKFQAEGLPGKAQKKETLLHKGNPAASTPSPNRSTPVMLIFSMIILIYVYIVKLPRCLPSYNCTYTVCQQLLILYKTNYHLYCVHPSLKRRRHDPPQYGELIHAVLQDRGNVNGICSTQHSSHYQNKI